jgi:Uma2 family endonuclease
MYITTADKLAEQMPNASHLLSDEPEMESSAHYFQLMLLVSCLDWLWQDRQDYFIGANLTVYFSREQLKNRDFRGPDLFVVKNVVQGLRPSWVVWEEDGRYPDLIIELLSESTADSDRGLKKELYQSRFRTPEYFWYSPTTYEFMGWRLVGHTYEEIASNAQGWRWSEELELYLGVATTNNKTWLCYFTADGQKVLTPSEIAKQGITDLQEEQKNSQRERLRADQEHFRAEQEQLKNQRLADRLRALGINPDGV